MESEDSARQRLGRPEWGGSGHAPGTGEGRQNPPRNWLRRWCGTWWGRATTLVAAVMILSLVVDGRRPPPQQVGVRMALGTIRLYQASASKVFAGLGARCRFEPTCSHYGHSAIRNRGLVPGTWLVLRRVARCAPWTPAGTLDPPPGPIAKPNSEPVARSKGDLE